jgi:hypothetical protein
MEWNNFRNTMFDRFQFGIVTELAVPLSTVNTVKPVLNGISRDQKIFPLKPGFRLIKVYYKNLISQGT